MDLMSMSTSAGDYMSIPSGFVHDYSEDMPRALYVHIPFCAKRCQYCDFATWATVRTDTLMANYVDSLIHSLHQLASVGLLTSIQTVYLGGGTPSLLGEKLVHLVKEIGQLCAPVEFSCEANPESFSQSLAQDLAVCGVTRISLGVQSLVDQELEALGRVHSAQTAHQALTFAKQAGLDVSADLMCGIPLQTHQSWEYSINQLLNCGVDHLSIYPLMIEEHTPFWKQYQNGLLALPDDDVQAQMMCFAQNMLQQQGFSRYEVASYARPNKQCQHNLAYWSGVSYLALGASGSAMLSKQAYEAFCKLVPHMPQLDADISRVRYTISSTHRQVATAQCLAQLSYSLELLTDRQAAAEDLMLAARTSYGITPVLYARACAALGRLKLDAALNQARRMGLLEQRAYCQWTPTQQGWLLGNELYGLLWDLAQKPVASMQIAGISNG